MGAINWGKDADAAFAQAKSAEKPVLLDFSAAPM
ncbi:MAG: thioredoxin family protein [candidate division Zixibacteria bacterium]|nr:thioredoxin family protein [candidate division Zixibacteria bacterium]MCI0597436.1 thioredoxin family protein [candidate division Zixibacteria bacterium]